MDYFNFLNFVGKLTSSFTIKSNNGLDDCLNSANSFFEDSTVILPQAQLPLVLMHYSTLHPGVTDNY